MYKYCECDRLTILVLIMPINEIFRMINPQNNKDPSQVDYDYKLILQITENPYKKTVLVYT